MNIKEFLFKALNSDEILNLTGDKKVHFLHAKKTTTPYLEYEVISEREAYSEEGNEKYTNYLVQVDIFSEVDYSSLEEAVKKELIKNGFSREQGADLYEKETGLYHKAMRFNIALPF
nr:prohead protease [Clostridium perfringens]